LQKVRLSVKIKRLESFSERIKNNEERKLEDVNDLKDKSLINNPIISALLAQEALMGSNCPEEEEFKVDRFNYGNKNEAS
jgi:hypothetical protein